MSKVTVTIDLDTELKRSAEALFMDLGMDLETAIALFLTEAVNEQSIPFEIKREIPNEITKLAFDEYSEMKKNPHKYKRYDSFKDALVEIF